MTNITVLSGVAAGAGLPYLSILALNVRTEIAYGMSKDGCTAMYWRNEQSPFLAQNWDWQEEQKDNLINLNIKQKSKPAISMITEAGIIGKIGLNSSGVGVCLNAIRAFGVDFGRLPCHLALRVCLESETASQAVAALQKAGVASACHILIGDAHQAIGLECTSIDTVQLPSTGVLTHTNHLIKSHPGVEDKMALEDSPVRLNRINALVAQQLECGDASTPNLEEIRALMADQDNYPTAICRSKTDTSSVATLFSIVMNLKKKVAEVSVGRVSEGDSESLHLAPSE